MPGGRTLDRLLEERRHKKQSVGFSKMQVYSSTQISQVDADRTLEKNEFVFKQICYSAENAKNERKHGLQATATQEINRTFFN